MSGHPRQHGALYRRVCARLNTTCCSPERTRHASQVPHTHTIHTWKDSGCSTGIFNYLDTFWFLPQVCLGTMTWGVQNSEAEAHAQLDYAVGRGVNFIDTAEMYPVPSSAPGWKPGRTEEIIGTW